MERKDHLEDINLRNETSGKSLHGHARGGKSELEAVA